MISFLKGDVFLWRKEKMKQLSSAQIRSMFLEYFKSKDHMVEPGASLIPINDPTLLWINSGVSALKKYFDGREKPLNNRICNAQKSIRTNDIENVGRTARHHTFFEMLGNFSIGAYFKHEAIAYAYEFLTAEQWMGIDPQKLYITVYTDDHEAYDIWVNEIGFNPAHILKTMDNFWQIGDGPCGPDTEIFFDRGEDYDPDHLGERLFFEEIENDRYIELWNVVFSQYDGKEGVERSLYKELPQKNIDTGMGLERLVSIIQGGETNFDTDLFLPLIAATEMKAEAKYTENLMAYRVIADHIRTVTFALSDGALFANEGRGYVLRRILRRAVRFGKAIGIEGPFMYQLVAIVADIMRDFYPYLDERKALVAKLVKQEEQRFQTTLNDGEALLEQALAKSETQLAGDVIFKLYDTYGFPFELTQEIALERGFDVDMAGFERAMEAQKTRARQARQVGESMHSQAADLINFTQPSDFIGYDHFSCMATVIGLFKDGVEVDALDNEGSVIFNQSCFYAESGGQVADTGDLRAEGFNARVLDVQKAPHKQGLHRIKVNEGILNVGDEVEMVIDRVRRYEIMANHSSAHLMQAALKRIVGDHIRQAGSYVSEEYMRFDFTHYEKVTDQQLSDIEALVNLWIGQHLAVHAVSMPIAEARQSGATALFDEKYGDIVRVVSIGEVSKEFCGGTHVANTGDLGLFTIISEESIGSGIRRITAKTSQGAYRELKQYQDDLLALRDVLRVNSVGLVNERVVTMKEAFEHLQKEMEQLQARSLATLADQLVSHVVEKDDLQILVYVDEDLGMDQLRQLGEFLKTKLAKYLFILIHKTSTSLSFMVGASPAAIAEGYKAGPLVRELALMADGKGGGRDDFAQAGGKNVGAIDQILGYINDKFIK